VLFVGYGRSGHSLIAAILDSHPEIIIPNELHILAKFKSFYKDPDEESYSRRLRIFSALHSRSYSQSIQGIRSPNNRRGYSYYIPGSWQGRYRNQIKVSKGIGPFIYFRDLTILGSIYHQVEDRSIKKMTYIFYNNKTPKWSNAGNEEARSN